MALRKLLPRRNAFPGLLQGLSSGKLIKRVPS